MRILSVRKGRTVPVLLFAAHEEQEEPKKYGLSEEEYRALVDTLSADQIKQRIISAIGLALVVIGIIILFTVATLTA